MQYLGWELEEVLAAGLDKEGMMGVAQGHTGSTLS